MSIAPFLHGEKAPVFLTAETSRELSANAVSAIVQGGFERVVLVGGPNAVATTVPTQLTNAGYEGTVERLAGNTRYATNAAVARWLVSDCGYSYNGMAIGSSEGFSDAFAGAGVCGKEKSVLLLVNGDAAPAGLTAITNVVANDARAANVLKIYFFGKTNAVPSELRSRALSALGWL